LSLLEDRANSRDLVDKILVPDNVLLAEHLLNNLVRGEGDVLSLDLARHYDEQVSRYI